MDNEDITKNKMLSHNSFHLKNSLAWLDSEKYWIDRNKNKESCDGGTKRKKKNTENQTMESRINDDALDPEGRSFPCRIDIINYAHLHLPGAYNKPGSACQIHRCAYGNVTNKKN